MSGESVEDVLHAADERLKIARFGLQDMANPARAQSGLYNAVVFGRMVTFALQNLRTFRADFDDWYKPKREEMRMDPLMRYFVELRNNIEKKAERHVSTSTYISSLNFGELYARLQPAPPHAVGFFIGDENGGSGWDIENSDGSKEKYYVNLPSDIGKNTLSLLKAPEQFEGLPANELVVSYLDKLETLLNEAKRTFF